MNVLSRERHAQVTSALVEGCSIRAVERLTGIHRDTIMRLGLAAGEGCHGLNDRLMRGRNVGCIELDEIWSYVGKKQKRLGADDAREELGDQYMFVALDATRKAILGITAAMALGITNHVWSIGELTETALSEEPPTLPPRPLGCPLIRGRLS